MVKRFLFDTRLGELVVRLFELLTGLGLVDLEELESWRYGTVEPTPTRQR